MEPVTSLVLGVTGNFVWDGLKHGYGALSADDFQDCFDAAADQTAREYDIDADAFDALFHADLPTEDLATFEDKLDSTAHQHFATRLQTATDTDLTDPEEVVTAFVRNVERELVGAFPDHGMQLLLDYAHEFIDSQDRRAEFEQDFTEEMDHLEDFIESAHDDTQSHVTDAHQQTCAEIVAEIESLRDDLADETDPLPESFQRLATVDFETTRDVERCWRIGFGFAEIRADYAFERRGRDDATTAIEELRAKLRDGDDVVVLGRPGSGKSTTCKAVAVRWHDRDHGDVFYHDPDAETPLDADGLETAIRQADGDCLVVVEDAVRPQVNAVFDVIDEFDGDDSVHFLLDARVEEWRSGDDLLDATEARDLWSHGLTEYQLPALDADECEKVIEYFEAETGHSVGEPADRIHRHLQQASGTGEMLLLGYYLAPRTTDGQPPGQRVASGTENPLNADVRETYDWLRGQDDGDEPGLYLQVGILVSLLKASQIGVQTEFVYTLGDSEEEYTAIEDVLEECTSQLVFEQNGSYETHHELWAVLFLEHLLDEMGDRRATEVFETCVNPLFALFDETEKREAIHEWSRGRLDFPDEMAEGTQSFADGFVKAVFDLGTRRPKLAPLFGQTEYSRLELPDVCSEAVEVAVVNKRGEMYLNRGDYEKATDEFERIESIVEENSKFDAEETKRWRASSLGNLGVVAAKKGAHDDAYDHFRDSLKHSRELDDKSDIAGSLSNLGNIARERDAYDDARKYLHNSLEIYRDLGHVSNIADVFTNLGVVAKDQGAYDDARDYHEKSLERFRELDNTSGIADSLINLGNVARERCAYDDARDYYHNSLELKQNLGDTVGIANSLTNLGVVAKAQGAYDDASGFYEHAFRRFQEAGAVLKTLKVLENLVRTEYRLGKTQQALDYCETASALIEQSEASGAEEFVETFQHYHTRLKLACDETPKGTHRLYQQTLGFVTERKGTTVGLLFRDLWDRREAVDIDSDLFDIVLSAGVGFAAHFEILDEDYPEYEQEDVLEAIAPHADRLAPPVARLYDCLTDSETDVESTSEDAEDESLRNLERQAYEKLYSFLVVEDMNSSDWFTAGLTQLLQRDESAWRAFKQAWDAHADPDSDEYEHVLGAGVALAARLSRLDTDDADDERTAILDAVGDHRDRLSDPMRAVFDAVVGDDPETTPDELTGGVDSDGDLSLADRERLAGAQLLADLDGHAEASSEQAAGETTADATAESGHETDAPPDLLDDYRAGLRATWDGDQHAAIAHFSDVWHAHDGETAPACVLHAGVAFAVLVRDDPAFATTYDDVIQTVERQQDRLARPARAVFDAETGETDVTPADLRPDGEFETAPDDDDETLAALAFATLLADRDE